MLEEFLMSWPKTFELVMGRDWRAHRVETSKSLGELTLGFYQAKHIAATRIQI
jgi:hypothetical protein